MANNTKYQQFGTERITADVINVTIRGNLPGTADGTYNNIKRVEQDGAYFYGDMNWLDTTTIAQATLPFLIVSVPNMGNILYAGENITYSLTITTPSKEEVTTTHCFDQARGYECIEEWTTLTEENVTTVADGQGLYIGDVQFTFADFPPETLHIILNGTEYECNRIANSSAYIYGGFGESGPDFSIYPFFIYCVNGNIQLITENAGTYTVKIEAIEEVVETTSCFKKAVKSIMDEDLEVAYDNTEGTLTITKTASEIKSLVTSGWRGKSLKIDDGMLIAYFPILSIIPLNTGLTVKALYLDIPNSNSYPIDFEASSNDDYPTANL